MTRHILTSHEQCLIIIAIIFSNNKVHTHLKTFKQYWFIVYLHETSKVTGYHEIIRLNSAACWTFSLPPRTTSLLHMTILRSQFVSISEEVIRPSIKDQYKNIWASFSYWTVDTISPRNYTMEISLQPLSVGYGCNERMRCKLLRSTVPRICCHMASLYKHSWMDQGPAWRADSWESNEQCKTSHNSPLWIWCDLFQITLASCY